MKLHQVSVLALFLLLPFEHQTKTINAAINNGYTKHIDAATSVSEHHLPLPHETRYIFVVTTDGLRWEEVFGGVDSTLLYNEDFLQDTAYYRERFWATTPSGRRQKLLPFLWKHIVEKGQIYGNRHLGNYVNTSNKMWFSYPGYNEMFSGRPDDRHIFTNSKWTNPNETVFEFLNRKSEWKDQIGLFATWDVFSAIFREKTSGLRVCCGKETDNEANQTMGVRQFGMNRIPPDFHTWTTAFQYITENHPRITYIGLDDTDSQAHKGHYDRYLDAAHRFDGWMEELWQFIQNDPEYRDRTTLLLTTDHGRGAGSKWTDHNMFVSGSDAIWIAAIGPDTAPLGEMQEPTQLYQKQIAQTVANLLGEYFYTNHEVAPAIATILQPSAQVAQTAVTDVVKKK
jgi:hypothetical protein